MPSTLQISFLFGVTLLCFQAYGYTYLERLNTESGFCEGVGYGKIAVGDVGYNNESCEKILCHQGYREVLGCGKMSIPPSCELVAGDGDYPACCPMPKCP